MKITTVNGVEIDTESQMYKAYLRDIEDEEKYGATPEPSGYRTLGDVMVLESRRRDREARDASQSRVPQEVRETVSA